MSQREQNTERTALFIGRFQPFHIGHLDAVKQMLEQGYSHVIIAVGSAQYSDSDNNPLTYQQRVNCIKQTLHSALPDMHYTLIPITDIHDDARWVNHVNHTLELEELFYDTVFTGNKLTDALFTKAGESVVPLSFREAITATEIRASKRNQDDSWKRFVHPSIVDDVDRWID